MKKVISALAIIATILFAGHFIIGGFNAMATGYNEKSAIMEQAVYGNIE